VAGAPTHRTVAVVGGGISGLAAAWELTGGAEGPGPDTPSVVVLEAGEQLGGKLRTEVFGGRAVDVGPDGFLGRRDEALTLCREIGLGDELEPIGITGAAVWVGGRRRTLPKGLVLGVPTRFLPAARSGVLGSRGALRLLVDLAAPRRDLRGPLGDRAIGPLVARKLGPRVVDRLVDPLVGGIHAGGVADMSAAAVFPLLLAASQRRGGFMRSLRRAAPEAGDGPAFWSLRRGVGSMVDRLAEVLGARGAEMRTGSAVGRLDRSTGPAWVLHANDGTVAADGVVLAVPAPPAAMLLAPHDAEVATLLRRIDYATVAVVTLTYPRPAVPDGLVGTGLLVPHGTPAPPELGGNLLVTACSYLSAKWPHLSRPDEVLLRASVGRFGDERPAALDDDELVSRVAAELRLLLDVEGAPTGSLVTRWPASLPQYRVHHLLRVTGIEAATTRLPAVALAGACYRGVGIPACVAGGRGAGQAVLRALSDGPRADGPRADGPRADGPRADGPRADGPRADGPPP
jgi:protoporphyrinogen/coproporphyrinogen III oxidase